MNTLYSSKLNEIQQMNEAEFTIDVVIPLFEELGYRGLRYTHGISEYGMDVVCYEISKFGLKRYIGVQVKVGNVGGTRKVQDIISQAKASFNSHYLDISSQIEYNINELYVVTTGKITEYAKNQIINSLNSFSGNIKFFDGESIIDILYKNNPEKIKLNYDDYFELFFYKLYEKYDELLGDISDIEKDKTLSYLNSNKIKKNSARARVVGLNPSTREYEDNFVSNSQSIMERHNNQMRYFDKTPYTFFKHVMKYFDNPVKTKLGWIKTPWEKVGYLDIVKCPVRIHPQARSQWGSLSKRERREIISNCSEYLVNQLNILKPKLVMAYGADVCRWFYHEYTSKDAFTVTKSSILHDYNMKVILIPQTRGSHPQEIIDNVKDTIATHL